MNDIIKKSSLIAILITQSMILQSMNNNEQAMPNIQFTSKEDGQKTISKYVLSDLTIVKEVTTRHDYETWQPIYAEYYYGFTSAHRIDNEDAEKIFKHIECLGKMGQELDSLVKQAELRRQEKAQKAREYSERILAKSSY